jgi:small subunit ribosomal protein S15e
VALTLTSTFLQLHPLTVRDTKAPWSNYNLLQPHKLRPSPNQLTPVNRLLDLTSEQLRDIVHARARRRFNRGLKRKPMGLIKKLRKAKQAAKPNEKPDLVKTHLRDMIVVPEMIGSVIGIYSGKEFNQVEIKPEMVGFYLGEFSISYKPVKHGRPGIGATHSSRFIPLK